MRRVLVYLRWKSDIWITKAEEYFTADDEHQNGAICYANRQAFLLRALADRFATLWMGNVDSKEGEAKYSLISIEGRNRHN